MRRSARFLAGLSALLFLNGCSGFFVKPVSPVSPEASRALLILENQQQTQPECFKGLGKVALQSGASNKAIRLAWMIELPDKMRVEFLAPTGHTLFSLSADGRYIYTQSHIPPGELKKYRTGNINLKRITGVPVKKEDLLVLLSGRFPIRPYDAVRISGDRQNGYVLHLQKKWRGVVERVYFDGALESPYKIELLDGWGDEAQYSATIKRWQQVDGLNVPHEIVLSGGDNLTATLTVRRFWVETDIDDEQFVLIDGGK